MRCILNKIKKFFNYLLTEKYPLIDYLAKLIGAYKTIEKAEKISNFKLDPCQKLKLLFVRIVRILIFTIVFNLLMKHFVAPLTDLYFEATGLFNIIETIDLSQEDDVDEEQDVKSKIVESSKKIGRNISDLLGKKKEEPALEIDDTFEALKKLSELNEMGVITQEEFDNKKTELLSKI